MSRSLYRHDSSGLADRCAVFLLALPVLLLAACGSDSSDDDDDGGGGTDTVAPTISAAVEPAANDAGWHNADVTVTFTCADTGSGIATCTDPVVVDTEGENQVVTGTATDQAGNTASTTVSINLDATPPALADFDPADGATVPQPGVNLTGTVTDSLSGTVSASCTDGGTTNEAVLNEGGSADERYAGRFVYPDLIRELYKRGAELVVGYAMDYDEYALSNDPIILLGGFGNVSYDSHWSRVISSMFNSFAVVNIKSGYIAWADNGQFMNRSFSADPEEIVVDIKVGSKVLLLDLDHLNKVGVVREITSEGFSTVELDDMNTILIDEAFLRPVNI